MKKDEKKTTKKVVKNTTKKTVSKPDLKVEEPIVVKNKKNDKYSSLKLILIVGAVVVALGWFFSSGLFLATGEMEIVDAHISILDYFMGLAQTITVWPYELLFVLGVGGFYGVLSKLSGYQNVVNKLGKYIEKNALTGILSISLIIALISTVFTDITYLILILPFAISILSRAKLNKFAVFSTTFGSALLGVVGPLFTGYGFDDLYLAIATADPNLAVNAADYIMINLVVLFVGYGLLNAFTMMKLKHVEVLEDKYEVKDTTDEVSYMPLFIVLGIILSLILGFTLSSFIDVNGMLLLGGILIAVFTIIFVLLFLNSKMFKGSTWPVVGILFTMLFIFLLGFVNWSSITDATIFTDFHNYIMNDLAIVNDNGTNNIIANMLGSSAVMFGSWANLVAVVFILVSTLVVGKTARMKFNDILDSFVNGVKIIFYPAMLFLLAHVITLFSSWIPTVNFFGLELINLIDGYNILIVALIGIVYGMFVNDGLFLSYLLGTIIAVTFAESAGSAALVINTIFGYMQFIVPGSILLLMGLEYCNIKYLEWLKYAWRFLVGFLVVLILIMLFI